MFLSKDSKSPFYQITYFVNGKRTKKSTKTSNLKEAKIFLANFNPLVKQNNIVVELNPIIKLSEFKDEYINYTKLSKSKCYVERSIEPALKFLLEFTGDVDIKSISVRTLDNFITARFNISKASAALYYRTIKAAFNKALSWNYLEINPLTKIKAPKVTKSLPVFIKEDELNLIVDKTKDQLLKDIFITGFFSGMRLGEILNMKWDWVNFEQNIIVTKNSSGFTTKSKKERVIPIHSKLLVVLSSRSAKNIHPENLIFTNSNGIKLNANYVSKKFKKALRAAELNDDIHFHNLRHSFASNLVQKGASIYVVKELLGHEDIKTTQVYSHLTQNSLENAVQLL